MTDMIDALEGQGTLSPELIEALKSAREADEQEIRELRRRVGDAWNNQELLTEAIAELELALEDTGWQRVSGFGDREFSTFGLSRIRRLARLAYLKNPLIRHAVNVQSHYVWGQGATISAGSDEVNVCIQQFLDDPKNIVIFSGHMARLMLENELQVEGDVFLPMFTKRSTGRVVIRRFNPDEITEIITNPEDYMEPWFYKRVWHAQTLNYQDGTVNATERISYYPDWRFVYNVDPDIPRPDFIGEAPVVWDAPVYHIKVGGFGEQKFGCPEIYAALDWARAVKEDLEDYATIKRAHSRFAFQITSKGGRTGAQAIKTKLGTTMNQGGTGQIETNPPPISGSGWIAPEGMGLQGFKTAGLIPSPDEGKRLGLMVAAGTGIPETILFGNADSGNLATAKTLDRPTELQMENRRILWADAYTEILNYVIDMAIKAPDGMLDGEEVEDQELGLVHYELSDEADREIDVRFPSILRHDIFQLIQAIVWAVTLNGKPSAGLIDDRTAAQLLLNGLGENEYDDVVETMFPQDQGVTTLAGTVNNPALGQVGVSASQKVQAFGGASSRTSDPQPGQGEQSSNDAGQGNMGGGTQPSGLGFDPYQLGSTGMMASKRAHLRTGSRLMESHTMRKHRREVAARLAEAAPATEDKEV